MKPCKIYQGYIAKNGYGHQWNPRTKKNDCAHRVAYEQHIGAIPEGCEIDHLCKVRACVEPTHLDAVTHYENCHRGRSTRLTDQQVLEIRASTGSSYQIAARYGVHDSTVRRIRSFKRHKLTVPVGEQSEVA